MRRSVGRGPARRRPGGQETAAPGPAGRRLARGPLAAGILALGTMGAVSAVAWPAAATAAAVGPAPAPAGAACRSGPHPGIAARMSAEIAAVLRNRSSDVGLAVSAPAAGVTCEVSASRQFDSASIVKATILAALLHADNARPTRSERARATAMITESDNDAASDLWRDVGPVAMRQFLSLAKMTRTIPGAGGYWGLTQVTAHDQMKLLHLLTTPNPVLSQAARSYELGLMARVDPAQRWGVSAGAPPGATVELKNGWLPAGEDGWQINSIGCVSAPGAVSSAAASEDEAAEGREYCLTVLSAGNPSMAYGVRTVSEVATVVNTDLSSPLAAAPAVIRSPATAAPPAPSAVAAPAVPPAAAAPAGMPARVLAGIVAGLVTLALFAVGAARRKRTQ